MPFCTAKRFLNSNLNIFKTMWKRIAGVVAISSILYSIKKYFAGGVCRCTTRLEGLVIIITGATSGIGKALATELAIRGATLVLACRNVNKAQKIREDLIKKHNIQVEVKELDLNSFESIIQFSDYINYKFKEVYALVNNAGVFYYPQQLTRDNFDITLQTNYLGPFVLTHHLLKVLRKSKRACIVNVVSEAHRFVNYEDLKTITNNQETFRDPIKAYSVSKLALVLFTKALAKKLVVTNILVNAVNPGNVETDIFRHYPPLSNPWLYAVQWIIRIFVIKRPCEGAQTILHVILTSDKFSGQYLSDCKFDIPSDITLNNKLSQEYYNLTLEILADKFITESEC